MEIFRRASSRPVDSAATALALANEAIESTSQGRRRRALGALRAARQQIHQYQQMPTPDPTAKANYSTARLDLLDDRLAEAEARLAPKETK